MYEKGQSIGLGCAVASLGHLIAMALTPKLQSTVFALSYAVGGFLIARDPARALGSRVQGLLAPMASALGCGGAGLTFAVFAAAEGTRLQLVLGSGWFWLLGGFVASTGFIGRGAALVVPLAGAVGFGVAGALGRATLDLAVARGSTVAGMALAPAVVLFVGGTLLTAASNAARRAARPTLGVDS